MKGQDIALRRYHREFRRTDTLSDSDEDDHHHERENKNDDEGPFVGHDDDDDPPPPSPGLESDEEDERRENDDDDSRQCSYEGVAPTRKRPLPASLESPRQLYKDDLKPSLNEGDEVWAAWWPDAKSRRDHTKCSWYPGRIIRVRESYGRDRVCDYGPIRYYSVEYDDGDELDDVEDTFVMRREDYEFNRQVMGGKRVLRGVENEDDKNAKDPWARNVGWYNATIDGKERSFSLLAGK